MPSIDLSSISNDHSRQRHQKQGSSGSTEISNPTRRGIVKRASKLSFKMLNRENNKEGSVHEKEKELPSRPSGGTTLTATPSSGSSFFNVSSNAHTVLADSQRSETDTATPVPTTGEESLTRPVSPSTAKTLPPIPRDYAATPVPPHAASMLGLPAGETDEDLFELIGANKLAVRFEINVVKVRVAAIWQVACMTKDDIGSMAATSRYSIQTCKRRRMAIPYARTKGAN
jgi:hypothetical protein